MPARVSLSILDMIEQLLMSSLLHSSLHSDITFLIEELLINIIILITLSDTRNRFVALRFIRVLFTTVLEQRVVDILVDFGCALGALAAFLVGLGFTALFVVLVIGVSEHSVRVALGRVGALGRVLLATRFPVRIIHISCFEYSIAFLALADFLVLVMQTATGPLDTAPILDIIKDSGETVLRRGTPLSHRVVSTALH